MTYAWFDDFLKGENNHIFETMSNVRYFTMGITKQYPTEVKITVVRK